MSKYEYNQLFHYVFRLCFRPILLHNCQTFVASLEWVTDESFRLPERFSEDFYYEMPKKFSKFHVPGTEMMFIADEKLISTVFRHVMFCVTQAVTS